MTSLQDSTYDSDHEEEISPLLGSRVGNGHTPYRPGSAIGVPSTVVEPPNVYRSRWRSIRVMYLTMFLGSVTFTITMSSLWPFLQVLNAKVSEGFLGWVVAAYSLGQLIASPVFGYWANFRNSSREPLTASLVLTTLSNLFYMYLQSLPSHQDYYMILARGLIGFSAGNVAVVRSYVSGATTMKERTSCMANVSIFQAMGFILGPVIQAALVPISYPGPSEHVGFHFNMYTAPAFFAVCVALVNLVLLVFVFKEHHVYDDDINSNVQGSVSDEEAKSMNNTALNKDIDYKPDYVAVASTNFLFFVILFMFTVFETIGTPLTMHMYAWSKSKATLYQGIILSIAGLCSIFVFLFVKILAKKFNERYLLFAGFIFCLCGYFIFIPWGDKLPPRGLYPVTNGTSAHSSQEVVSKIYDHILLGDTSSQTVSRNRLAYTVPERKIHYNNDHQANVQHFGITVDNVIFSTGFSSLNPNSPQPNPNMTEYPLKNSTATTPTTTASSKTSTASSNTTGIPHNTTYIPEGCPWNYDWCSYVPAIYLAQYLCGTIFISVGYPMCNMLSYTIYSKVLGPKPQGLWMGWLTASGSLARTVGPIYVSQVYDYYGPQVTFGSCCGFILATIVFYLLIFRRLVPFSFKDESLTRFGGSVKQR